MTRKDYETIALAIKLALTEDAKNDMYPDGPYEGTVRAVMRIAAELQAQNPRFKRETFMKACGLPETT